MTEKKTIKALSKSDYDNALQEAKALLDILRNQAEWTVKDEKKLVKLKQIVAILGKLPPTQKQKNEEVFDRKKDESIVRRFIERMKNERL